ncbi:MAG: hypothetical protein RSC95_03745 [Anaerovoracaceae bacterium]
MKREVKKSDKVIALLAFILGLGRVAVFATTKAYPLAMKKMPDGTIEISHFMMLFIDFLIFITAFILIKLLAEKMLITKKEILGVTKWITLVGIVVVSVNFVLHLKGLSMYDYRMFLFDYPFGQFILPYSIVTSFIKNGVGLFIGELLQVLSVNLVAIVGKPNK